MKCSIMQCIAVQVVPYGVLKCGAGIYEFEVFYDYCAP